MRVVTVAVSQSAFPAVLDALEAQEFTVVALERGDVDGVVLEIPVPSDAVGDVFDVLEEAGVSLSSYTVVTSAEAGMTATGETLESAYVGQYRSLTPLELRSKARDLSLDPRAFLALMVLSALIAAAGLLLDSPAIVVGSMVIAPILGPSLTASVGAVTGDRQMVVESLWMQSYGLAAAVGTAAALGMGAQLAGVVPSAMDLSALDLFGVRLAPNALSLLVGAAAGLAAGIGLTTKGPTSIIGVMIAAALIPAAAASGLAIAWLEPELAVGTAALLVATMVLINVSVLSVLVALGYRTRGPVAAHGGLDRSTVGVVLLAVLLVGTTLAVGAATAHQVAVDRQIQTSVDETLADPAAENLTAVSVQTQYGDLSPFTGPRTVTVVVSQDGPGDLGTVADGLAERIETRTGESVEVRLEPIEYESAGSSGAT